MLWYVLVWYGMVFHGLVWCDVSWYGMVWYDVSWFGMVWSVLAILINFRRQKIAADISKFGGSSAAIFCHYKLTL
jgi:hypothetical protein